MAALTVRSSLAELPVSVQLIEAIHGRLLAGVRERGWRQRAAALVARLRDTGVLNEMTGYGRNRPLLYDGYVRLFRREGEAAE